MNYTFHDKLVRDNIPKIIIADGKGVSIKKSIDPEASLKAKLREEFDEFLEAESNECKIEELADILEVLQSLAKVSEFSVYEVEERCKSKRVEKGGFDDFIILNHVETKDGDF